MLGSECAVAEESRVLGHTICQGHIIVLAPAAKRVEKQDWVSVSLGNELLTGVFQEQNVAIVERVSDLEGVDDIGVLLDDSGLNLFWGESVLIVAIVEDWSLNEAHGVTADQEISLSEDGLSLGVVGRHAAEGTSADLFLSIVKEAWVLDDSKDGFRADGGALDGNLGLALEFSLLFSSHRLGDRDGEEMTLALGVGDGLHVHDLEELELVHESLEWVSPAITNGLEVLDLVLVDVKDWESSELLGFLV